MPAPFRTIEQIIVRHVDKMDACWIWKGSTTIGGYSSGCFQGKKRLMHRVFYECLKGPIPEGLQIDHLCKNIRCVNPDHLEPVTPKVNSQRGRGSHTHCLRGHLLSGENLYRHPRYGSRGCKTCRREQCKQSILRRKCIT